MKRFLVNRKKRRASAGRFLAMLLMVCMLLQNNQLCVQVLAAALTEEDAFNVPFGDDLKNYDPDKDGYYAYLKVKYEDIGVPYSEKGKTYVETFVPVLVFRDHLFMDIDYFTGVTGAERFDKTSPTGDARVRLNVFQRYVFLSENKNTLYYYLGDDEFTGYWLDQTAFILDTAPMMVDGNFYVPFIDLMEILGVQYDVVGQSSSNSGEKFLQIESPRKNVYDVLAEIKNDDSGYPFTYGSADLSTMTSSSDVCLTLHGILQSDWHSWARAMSAVKVVDKEVGEIMEWAADEEQCEELFERLMTMSEDEGKYIDTGNIRDAIELTQYLMKVPIQMKKMDASGMFKETLNIVLDWESSSIRDAFLKSNLKNYDKVMADLANAQEYVDEINKKLDDLSDGLLKLGIITDIICNAISYSKRDAIIQKGMKDIFSKEYMSKYQYSPHHLESGCLIWMSEKSLENLEFYSVRKAFFDNIVEIIKAKTKAGHPFLAAYDLFAEHIPVYGERLKSMENFKLSTYAVPFQYDTRDAAMGCLHDLRLGVSEDTEIVDAIELTYLYLKSCYTARGCAIQAFKTSEKKKDFKTTINFIKGRNSLIAENLAILSCGYGADRKTALSCLLPSARKCREKMVLEHTEEKVGALLLPLYMKVTGQVRVNNAEETPVLDAVCSITGNEAYAGYFEGTEDGAFSVYVPVMKAITVMENSPMDQDLDVYLYVTSPSVEGEGTAYAEFVPGGEVDIGTIYLGDEQEEEEPAQEEDYAYPGFEEEEETQEPENEEQYDIESEEEDEQDKYVVPDMTNISVPEEDVREYNGHSYCFLMVPHPAVNEQMTDFWMGASICRELDGHLATITSREEQEFVGNMYANSYWHENVGIWYAMIGAYREDPGEPWRWVTGEDFTYSDDLPQDSGDTGSLGKTEWIALQTTSPYFAGDDYSGPFGIWHNYFREDPSDYDSVFLLIEWDYVR